MHPNNASLLIQGRPTHMQSGHGSTHRHVAALAAPTELVIWCAMLPSTGQLPLHDLSPVQGNVRRLSFPSRVASVTRPCRTSTATAVLCSRAYGASTVYTVHTATQAAVTLQ